jgi:hypothetical protein
MKFLRWLLSFFEADNASPRDRIARDYRGNFGPKHFN